MKKSLLFLSFLGTSFWANAQERVVLYEEFTGENCPPCAATNPGLEALMNSSTNPENIIIIKYQVPIPSAGPLYLEYTDIADNRRSYYSVSSAPNGRIDGSVSPGGDGSGHPAYLTQTHIDSRVGAESPFTITFSDVSITDSDVSASITVEAVEAGTYGDLKLRVALVETLDFETAPGTNGETHFMNVVREMYPDADGQAADNSWTAGETNTYTISGSFSASEYSSINNEHFLVVWLQDDEGKEVHQAARTYPENEIKSEGIIMESDLLCGTPNTFAPTVTFRNKGSNTLTSATIFYKESLSDDWSSLDWTGSLSTNEMEEIVLPDIISENVGQIVIIDSVGNPNGTTDKFLGNNVTNVSTFVLANEDGIFPIETDFETETPLFTPYYSEDGYPIFRFNAAGQGYDASDYMMVFPCYQLSPGTQGFTILPFADLPEGEKAMDFYVAYCQYDNENDKLEIVYSTDCGESWTSVWSKQGSGLATKAKQSSSFIPNSNSQWKMYSADLSDVPNGAQIAFRATSQYGNNMFIDNINLRVGTPANTGISEILNVATFALYPNPVADNLNINFDAKSTFKAHIVITNVSGQIVSDMTKNIATGENKLSVNVSQLPAGTYFLTLGNEENGTVVKKFVKH